MCGGGGGGGDRCRTTTDQPDKRGGVNARSVRFRVVSDLDQEGFRCNEMTKNVGFPTWEE